MDPVAFKFTQLAFLEIVGGVLLLGGVYSSFKNLSGKSHLFFEGLGLTVRLKNATPGVLVALIGLGAMWMSLDSKVIRRETVETPPSQSQPTDPPSAPAPTKRKTVTITEIYMEYKNPLVEKLRKLWQQKNPGNPRIEK